MKSYNNSIRLVLGAVVLALIVMLVAQNRYHSFVILGIRIPVLIAVIGLYIAWWYSSKALGGTLNRSSLKARYNQTEASLNQAVSTQAAKIKTLKDEEGAEKTTTTTTTKPVRKTPPKRTIKKTDDKK